MIRSPRLRLVVAALFALSLITSACSSIGATAQPAQPGQYTVQKDSVHFDGERYSLYWTDSAGALHRMETRNLKMVRDQDRTFLEVQSGTDPTLHLREDEPITVDGRDNGGGFSSPWFPFFAGALIGNAFGGGRGQSTIIINNPAPGERGTYAPNTATYRYPPTGSFGRDEQLNGSLDSSKAQTPDYSKVQPSPYATSGKSSGSGGGVAASNKAPSSGSAVGAAASKGGFASGSQSSSGASGAGSSGALKSGGSSGTLSGKSSSSPSIGKGIGGARSVGRR
jgi:hypothetical protein